MYRYAFSCVSLDRETQFTEEIIQLIKYIEGSFTKLDIVKCCQQIVTVTVVLFKL
jgi:hypothetical protein